MYRLFFYGFLRFLPTEWVHHTALTLLRLFMAVFGGLLRPLLRLNAPELAVDALGLRFAHPVGLAAGFDKNATAYEALAALGFAFVEIGTVTGQPQPGNPKPRMFRLPSDRALINRMGFNNLGADAVSAHLGDAGARSVPVGVNIGKTKVVPEEQAASDYVHSTRVLGPLADYLVVNVSSPNTPGLRNLQAVELLRPLLAAVKAELGKITPRRPLLVKIAPDLNDADIDAIADLALELELDGIIATNTTISRSGLATPAAQVEAIGAGGLSGAILKARSLEVLQRLYRRVGARLTLISVGGIETADDAWARLRAGATLVQIYTGFVYGGPLTIWSMQRGLRKRLKSSGVKTVSELIGSAATTAG